MEIKPKTSLANHIINSPRVIVTSGWRRAPWLDCDLDFSAFFCDSSHRIRQLSDFVFYNNPKTYNGGVELEHRNIDYDEDDTISINVNAIPSYIKNVYFVASLGGYPGLTFSKNTVTHLYARLIDETTREELICFNFDPDNPDKTAIVTAQMHCEDERWIFTKLGKGVDGGLVALCSDFGAEL